MARVKRRRSSGLRGTPREHQIEAKFLANNAFQIFQSAKEKAEAGNCARAFVSLRSAIENYGAALSNVRDGNLTRETASIPDADYDAANAAFKKHCMVRGGLSGLGRRPSRRRK